MPRGAPGPSPGAQLRAHGVLGHADGGEGRAATADLHVSPEALPLNFEPLGVMGKAGGVERRIAAVDLQAAPEPGRTNSELHGAN